MVAVSMPLIFVVWEKENDDANKKKIRNHDLEKVVNKEWSPQIAVHWIHRIDNSLAVKS